MPSRGRGQNLPETVAGKIPATVSVYWSPYWRKWITRQVTPASGPPSAKQLRCRALFAEACQLIKNQPAEYHAAAYEFTKGTKYLPRDAMTSAAFGILYMVTDQNGRTWAGARLMYPDIQSMLNTIAATKGAMLWFDGEVWNAIMPDGAGKVLTVAPDGQTIAWQEIVIPPAVEPADPTAVGGDEAVPGTAETYMRSDACPAIQKGSATVFGVVKVDGETIRASGGVLTAPPGGSGSNGIDRIVIPTAATFPTLVSGDATLPTLTDGAYTMQFDSGAVVSGDKLRMALKAARGPTFTITMGMRITMATLAYRSCGLFVYDGTKVMAVHLQTASTTAATRTLQVTKYTNTSTYNSNAVVLGGNDDVNVYFRIQRDATNLSFYFSYDGVQFVKIFQEARSTFLGTPTYYGIGSDANLGSTTISGDHIYASVFYWNEGP